MSSYPRDEREAVELEENRRKEPYTDSTTQANIKPRTVYCKYCKYTVVTALPGPRCGKCRAYLICVPQHVEKLDELAR